VKDLQLNADLGESTGNDAFMMPYLQLCNIACGGHAGNKQIMHDTIQLAKQHQVKIGVHPSYPDKENFGRKKMDISKEALAQSLREQLTIFHSVAMAANAEVFHVKAHGALYHVVAHEQAVWNMYAPVVLSVFPKVKFMLPANTSIEFNEINRSDIIFEAFADRRYLTDLNLVLRKNENAVLITAVEIAEQIATLLTKQQVLTENKKWVNIQFDTICMHGDHPQLQENLPKIIELLKAKKLIA